MRTTGTYHRARFGSGIQTQIFPRLRNLSGGEPVFTTEDRSAIVDGGDLAMQDWVAGSRDFVGANADERSEGSGAVGVVHDRCSKGLEGAGYVRLVRCGFLHLGLAGREVFERRRGKLELTGFEV